MTMDADRNKRKRVSFLLRPGALWQAVNDAEFVVAFGTAAGAGLITLYHDTGTLILGVPASDRSVYKADLDRPGHEVTVDGRWIWGRATEPYDHCLEYLGVGPLLEVCWPGGDYPPVPVRMLGKACAVAATVVDDVLTWAEPRLTGLLDPRSTLGRINGWLSTRTVGALFRLACDLDGPPCDHPGCSGSDRCFYPADDGKDV